MQKWEYLAIHNTNKTIYQYARGSWTSVRKCKEDADLLIYADELGTQGWELITIQPGGFYMFIFKRPIP